MRPIEKMYPNVTTKYMAPLVITSAGVPSSVMADMKLARMEAATGKTPMDLWKLLSVLKLLGGTVFKSLRNKRLTS